VKSLLILAPFEISIPSDVEYDSVYPEEPTGLADFFNSKKELAARYKATLFLDGLYTPKPKGIDFLFNYLMNTKEKVVVGAYCDITLVDKNNKKVADHVNASYSPYLVKNGTYVDSPLMLKTNIFPDFDNKIEQTVLYEAFLSLAEEYAIFKCPFLCFNRKAIYQIPNGEIEYIKKKHYEQ